MRGGNSEGVGGGTTRWRGTRYGGSRYRGTRRRDAGRAGPRRRGTHGRPKATAGWPGGKLGIAVGAAFTLTGVAIYALPGGSHADRQAYAVPEGFQMAVTDLARTPVHTDPAAIAAALARRLGTRSAGSYLDRATGRVVTTITDVADARTVRAAGAVPKRVAHGGADLADATSALRRMVTTPGTGWGVDPAAGRVDVWADGSVTGARLAAVRAAVAQLGDKARVERVPGRFTTRIRGGDPIFGGGARCSLGFNVRSGSSFFFLTAGHCGNIARSWFADAAGTTLIGTTAASSFPGNDFAIVRYRSGVTHPGSVDLFNGSSQDITRAADAVVGQTVRRSGSTTGVHSGRVTAVDATVNYPEGTVTGLIRTTVCAEPGDSGGPLFSGDAALGLTSGGNGDCRTGGTTFFQPVTEPLSAFGVTVY